MARYAITKSFEFIYGHRLLGHHGRCAHLHGHNAKVEVHLESSDLNAQSMVADFEEVVDTLGKWVDENWDHKMILASNDPLVPLLRDAGERIVVIEKSPTAEILAHLLFRKAEELHLPVRCVTVWETEDSSASYESEVP